MSISIMSDLSNWQPCPWPEKTTLDGKSVMVEPFDKTKHQFGLWDALGGLASNELLQYFPNGPYDKAEELAEWLETMNQRRAYKTMMFVSHETKNIVGMASYMRIDPDNGVIEVGAVAHGAEMARGTMSTEAHYLMAKYIFDALGYRRYEWKLNNENAKSHRAAIRYGFTFEGVFRQHIVAKGKNRDTAWYSMLDGEWPQIRQGFEKWLLPDNFDRNGLQKQRLEDMR
jgi:RimJ/RimL family protein N-acetyltransferase